MLITKVKKDKARNIYPFYINYTQSTCFTHGNFCRVKTIIINNYLQVFAPPQIFYVHNSLRFGTHQTNDVTNTWSAQYGLMQIQISCWSLPSHIIFFYLNLKLDPIVLLNIPLLIITSTLPNMEHIFQLVPNFLC